MNNPPFSRISAVAGLVLAAFILIAGGAHTTLAQNTTEPKSDDAIKVRFDEKDPTMMYIESNGQRIRVNTVTKQIENLMPAASAPADDAKDKADDKTAKADDKNKDDLYAYESGDEPYDYKLINVPTPKKVRKGSWNLSFSHRFSQPINPIRESGKTLLGFDSMSASSFNVIYGVTDKLYFTAGRSPICQKGLCRTIELGLGYHITDQDKSSPLAVSVYGSVEGNENFYKQHTLNFQVMLSRNIGNRVLLFFSPAVHLWTNGGRRFNPVATDYFPAATVADTFKLPTHSASFGMGAQVRITPNVAALFDFAPRIGFKLGSVDPIYDANFRVIGFKSTSYPAMGIGVQYTIGKHSFTLTLSNTQTTTTSKYNSSNLVLKPQNLVIGFNLFRRW